MRQQTTDNRQLFSRRTNWNPQANRITLARQRRGSDLIDLTESNPTRASIDYPLDELSEIFARAARAPYTPDPRGLASAREALGGGDVILTASTSEAYAFLFKLLCDPGDEIITAIPSYPLFEHLAALESVSRHPFALEFHRRWEIDVSRIQTTDRTRAIVVVNPNNPTGSFVTRPEQEALASKGLPVISDEVFLDYPLEGRGGTSFQLPNCPTFALGGLSKSAGLPHYKLGWIRVSGPGKEKAIEALELIADNFLSVATPVQVALPEILRIAPRIRQSISQRTKRNLAHLRANASASTTVLPVEGGWSAVLRVPRTESDEELAVRLIEQNGVLVHPGYFFDFDSDGYIVISLLTEPAQFDEGVRRLFEALPR